MAAITYTAGDRVYRWVWVGGEEQNPQPLTVVRHNRKTVTVDTDQGSRIRVPLHLVEGFWTDDEDDERETPMTRPITIDTSPHAGTNIERFFRDVSELGGRVTLEIGLESDGVHNATRYIVARAERALLGLDEFGADLRTPFCADPGEHNPTTCVVCDALARSGRPDIMDSAVAIIGEIDANGGRIPIGQDAEVAHAQTCDLQPPHPLEMCDDAAEETPPATLTIGRVLETCQRNGWTLIAVSPRPGGGDAAYVCLHGDPSFPDRPYIFGPFAGPWGTGGHDYDLTLANAMALFLTVVAP